MTRVSVKKREAPRPKKTSHTPWGAVSNLGKDIGGAAVGIGPGLAKAAKDVGLDAADIVKHPTSRHHFRNVTRDILVPAAATYKQTYGPLAKGHFGAFAENLYQHPLGPVLDALTVADLGSSAAARVGLLKTGRATIATRSPKAAALGKGPVAKKLTDTKPIVRGRQTAVAAARSKLKYDAPIVGEAKQYGKAVRAKASQVGLRETQLYRDYTKAAGKLTDREQVALNIRARDIHPDDLAEIWKGKPNAKVVADPKVRGLSLNPSPRMVKAEAADRELTRQAERIAKEQGLLKDSTAAAKPAKPRAQASKILGRPARQIHGDPWYKPDVLESTKPPRNAFEGMGGGKGAPKIPGTLGHANEGVLLKLGKVDFKHDVIGPEFMKRVRLKVHTTIHGDLREAAVPVTDEWLRTHALPKGHDFLRPRIVNGDFSPEAAPHTGARQTVPATLKSEGEHTLEDLIPNPSDLSSSKLTDPFGTKDRGEALSIEGKNGQKVYYIVPERTIRAATGEFTRTSRAMRTLVERPLAVWRAIILGTRVGFLTNNVVGNNLMYAIRAAGNKGISSYLHALANAKGTGAVYKLLTHKDTPPGISQQFMREFFPEQTQGTFGRTQSPVQSRLAGKVSGKTRRKTAEASMGIIPKTQEIAEGIPRRAAVESAIRSMPEYKQISRDLPKDTRSVEAVARKLMTGRHGPEFQRVVSERVNTVLGDYLDLSPVERNAIRNLVPFYAWYRAITKVTYHLAADTPGRALALTKVGQIGNEDTERLLGKLPTYLRGVIPIGKPANGEATVVSTGGLNPYQTLAQLQHGATANYGELGLHPGLQEILTQVGRGEVAPGKILPAALLGTLTGLPPYRLGKSAIVGPDKTELYPHKTFAHDLAQYLGVPVKKPNLAVAHQRAAEGK